MKQWKQIFMFFIHCAQQDLMDDEADMLKQESNKQNEPVKKVIEYFNVQTFP